MGNEIMYSEAGIAAFGVGVILAILLVGFIAYIISSLTYYCMAKNDDIDNPWLAWIPLANLWVIGELFNEKLGGNGGLKVILAIVLSSIGTLIPFVGILICIALIVANAVFLYWLFEKYSERPVLHLVLSILTLGFYSFIVLFLFRNRTPRY